MILFYIALLSIFYRIGESYCSLPITRRLSCDRFSNIDPPPRPLHQVVFPSSLPPQCFFYNFHHFIQFIIFLLCFEPHPLPHDSSLRPPRPPLSLSFVFLLIFHRGNFSTVMLAVHKATGLKVAVKVVEKSIVQNKPEMLKNEVDILYVHLLLLESSQLLPH